MAFVSERLDRQAIIPAFPVSNGEIMVLTAGTDNALGLLAVDRDVPDGSEIA